MPLEVLAKTPADSARKTPLLFIHGAWHGAWCWEKYFLPYFTENGYTVYALSLRGHGSSEKPKRFPLTRICHYVTDVERFVSTLPSSPVIIGHSMGGLVAQKYLELHSAPAGVLLAPVPVKGVLRTTLRIARRHPWAFLKANLSWNLYYIIGTLNLTREAFFSDNISPEDLNEYFSLMTNEAYMAFLDMMLFSLPKPEDVGTELLILGAEKDMIFYPDEIDATAKAYNTDCHIVKGMAHDMMLEADWKIVADHIIQWLDIKGV